jgi:hypothetical protein
MYLGRFCKGKYFEKEMVKNEKYMFLYNPMELFFG